MTSLDLAKENSAVGSLEYPYAVYRAVGILYGETGMMTMKAKHTFLKTHLSVTGPVR